MESSLTIRNFGPIDSVELVLKNVNVFIGPQATGKSAIAKIYTLFKAPRKYFYKSFLYPLDESSHINATNEFLEALEDFNIRNFLKKDTTIVFDSKLHYIEFRNDRLLYLPKLYSEIFDIQEASTSFEANKKNIIKSFNKLRDEFIFFRLRSELILNEDDSKRFLPEAKIFKDITEVKCSPLLDIARNLEESLSTNAAVYIPAERNFINIIRKFAMNLQLNKVPIPTHILRFGAELEKVSSNDRDLGFLQEGLFLRIINGEERIFRNDSDSISLNEAASGIQSVVPIIQSIFGSYTSHHQSMVIEEPELNLSPTAQYELIKLLESNRLENIYADFGNVHTYTTHSPFILSALNNLLYSSKVRRVLFERSYDRNSSIADLHEKIKLIVDPVVPAYVDHNYFTAYEIQNGGCKSILDPVSGLIIDNYIDNASDKINEDFDALMELLQ